jgi:hypothetical protein
MSATQMLKETAPWILLPLLFAGAVRLAGIGHVARPHGGATTEQIMQLHPAPGAGILGTVLFSYDSATGRTVITLTMQHLVAGSTPRAEIREGTCGRSGIVVQVFPSVQADEHGVVRTVARRVGSFVFQHWVVVVKAGPVASRTALEPLLACGAL